MQTKSTLFVVITLVYLAGLSVYAESRAVADRRLKASLSYLQPSNSDVASLARALDALSIKSDELETTIPSIVKAPEIKADPLIVSTIRTFNQSLDRQQARELASLIEKSANRYGIDPLLVTALISQESGFHADAVSPVGAIGLGQLMPYTAKDLGVNPNDPAENLDGCVRYLAQNLDTWAHTADPVALALASYNAGPGAVSSHGGIPPYEETQNYVAVITDRYDYLLESALDQKSYS